MMQVKIKRLHPDARMPEYATDGSGCFDLYAATASDRGVWSKAGNVEFDTGVAFEVPEGYAMLIFSRSGFGFKHTATLVNSVGVGDNDFRDAIKVKYNNAIPAGVGDRIAQAMIIPIPRIEFEWADELTATSRGTNGFGSTGLK